MSRKGVDRWGKKGWFKVVPPPYLVPAEGSDLSYLTTTADDSAKLLGRVVEALLSDFTGEPNDQYVTLNFQITEVKGEEALTAFKGHEYLRDYLRTLVRRRSSCVNSVFDVTTKDGCRLRLEAVAITQYRVTRGQRFAIRRVIEEHLRGEAGASTLSEFVNYLLRGGLQAKLAKLAGRIAPIRHASVCKSKLLGGGVTGN